MKAPLAYQPGFEVPEDDERETIEEVIESLRKIGETVAADEGHAFRSVHAKSHGLLIARVEVTPGLPPGLAQGLFAQPISLPAVLRFSTTPGDLLSDKVSTPRGLAMKIVGVDGERSDDSVGDVTQDFVMVNGPAFSAPNASKFAKNLKLLAATTDRMPRTKNVLSAALRGTEALLEKTGHESATLKSLGGHPATNILGETFYTQVPLLHGRYMAKYSIAPVSPALLALTDEPIELKGHDDAIREAVIAHFTREGGQWELRAQLCTDIESMPIEDASVQWPEDESPYVTVAKIYARPQLAWSEERARRVDDGMAFNPWHCLAAHRPLGSVMRVRRAAYRASRELRARRNGNDILEPRSLHSLDE
ncbi:MAG: catalase family protein [Steroidobacteraceae bacterium]